MHTTNRDATNESSDYQPLRVEEGAAPPREEGGTPPRPLDAPLTHLAPRSTGGCSGSGVPFVTGLEAGGGEAVAAAEPSGLCPACRAASLSRHEPVLTPNSAGGRVALVVAGGAVGLDAAAGVAGEAEGRNIAPPLVRSFNRCAASSSRSRCFLIFSASR
jgi:hypothetical protein